jgi:hypothetical protein
MSSIGYCIKVFGLSLMIAFAFAYQNKAATISESAVAFLIGIILILFGWSLQVPSQADNALEHQNPDDDSLKRNSSEFRYYGKTRLLIILGIPIGYLALVIAPVVLPLLQNFASVMFDSGRF